MTDHTDLIARLREAEAEQREVAHGMDMDPKKTINWEHADCIKEGIDALEAARAEIERLKEEEQASQLHLERACRAMGAALARLAELGKQEPVAIAKCKVVHGHNCQWLNRTRHGMDTLRDGDKVYAAAGASPVQPSQPLFKEIIDKHQGLAEELRELDSQPTKGDQHEQQTRPEMDAVGGRQPVEGASPVFTGNSADLVSSITALLALDADCALVPHGIGGHARTLLTAAAKALEEQPSPVWVGEPEKAVKLSDMVPFIHPKFGNGRFVIDDCFPVLLFAPQQAAAQPSQAREHVATVNRTAYGFVEWIGIPKLKDGTKLYTISDPQVSDRAQPSQARVVEPVAPEIESVLEKWEKWALSTELDDRNHDLVDALADIRASRNVAEESLVKVLQACNEYLPPDGIDAKACISKILAIVDPWPLKATPQAAAINAKELK